MKCWPVVACGASFFAGITTLGAFLTLADPITACHARVEYMVSQPVKKKGRNTAEMHYVVKTKRLIGVWQTEGSDSVCLIDPTNPANFSSTRPSI